MLSPDKSFCFSEITVGYVIETDSQMNTADDNILVQFLNYCYETLFCLKKRCSVRWNKVCLCVVFTCIMQSLKRKPR